MTPHLVSSASGRAPNTPARRELPYVLIADANERRIGACIAAIKPHRHGALVASNGDEAAGILERFGPPVMLMTDVLLPPQGAFALIEEVRRIETTRTGIVAWAAARALREFTLCRLSGLNVRVLGGAAPAPVIQSLVEHLLTGAPVPLDAAASDEPATITEETVDWLQARARELCRTPGIAVYMRDGAGNSFRSSGSWTPDEPIPQSLDYLPHALNRVMETHQPFVALDVTTDPAGHGIEERGFGGLRGLVAVPIVGSDPDDVVGMICAFDVKPLELEPHQIESLTALGRTGTTSPVVQPVVNEFVARRNATPARVASTAGLREVGAKVPLLDRDAGSAAVARELARVRRDQHPLSVVLFDVDAPPPHGASDPDVASIDALGQALTSVIRGSDLAIRWSGQELLLVLPGVATAEARVVADRVRQAVRSGAGDRLAIIDGVAELGSDSWEAMLARASGSIREAYRAPANGSD